MQAFEEQTITLAAVCQVALLVQKLSRQGQTLDEEFVTLLNSVMVTSPDSTLEVYGGDISHLSLGLQTLMSHLGNQTTQKDPEITRYVVSLLSLERRLSKKPKQLAELGNRIEQCQRQLAHYDIDSETLVASLASIYSDIISPIGTPIQVAGNPEILKQPVNQHKIRALLLAGIRSAVLWRQVGGKRRTILFSRSKIVGCAEQLLKRI
ncbi:high frequency lysogenization protein HflD [Thalassotalea sp. SU-HH00458]|uniref:high frequency lysogenization protein HflD n=1 Tax=Thalassotalea sp. SU-HH00458 TaxID=3127657 RepID=UPI003107AE05